MMKENEEQQLLDEPRFHKEDGVEARLAALIESVIKTLGFRLVRIKLSGQNGLTLQIMMERADGSMNIEDCELLSRTISPILDVEDVISDPYHLEISSPGMDRPMVRRSDFERWKGHVVRLQAAQAMNGQRRFRGVITAVGEVDFTLKIEDQELLAIDFDNIAEARLVLTDDLIREALAKDKLREKEMKEKGEE